VRIDFGVDEDLKMKPFIIARSFYVALSRAPNRFSVFLKSFDVSYIQVNPKVEEKVNSILKFQPYLFKKIYLDEPIFDFEHEEIKC